MTDRDRALSTRDIAAAVERREPLPPEPPSDAHPHPDADDTRQVVLFPHEEAEGFRSRWEAIQTGFVDEPTVAVREADALVAQVVTRLAQVFSDERGQLEQQWGRGESVSTEDLRVALKRYRAFFHRLLSV